jgi:hypothetical protein
MPFSSLLLIALLLLMLPLSNAHCPSPHFPIFPDQQQHQINSFPISLSGKLFSHLWGRACKIH